MSIEKYGRLPATCLHGSGRKGRKRKQAKKLKRLFKNKCDHIICTMKIYVINVRLRVCIILKIDASRQEY